MFSNIGFAEIKLIEDVQINGKHLNYYMATICVDGHKFVITSSAGKTKGTARGGHRRMVQAFEERDGKSLPAKC